MKEDLQKIQPLGRILSHTGKSFLQLLNQKLSYLDIERNYYSLILIELGEGSLTQTGLASQLGTDKVSVLRIVDYLTAKGYIKRVKSPEDRRRYCLTLTSKAIQKLPGIKNALQEVTSAALNGLTEQQQEVFYSMLGIIRNNLSKANTSGI